MKTKITAAIGILGALSVTAYVGADIFEANAQTVPAESINDPLDELTGPEAASFGVCAQSLWTEVVISQIVEYSMWRIPGPDKAAARVIEKVTTDRSVFIALDLGGVVREGYDGACTIVDHPETDPPTVDYCVVRGETVDGQFTPAKILTPTDIACAKAATEAVVGPLAGLSKVVLLSGPPRSIETKRQYDMTEADYSAARAAKTVRPR